MNSDKIILHLCADIGSDSKPYEENGYKVIRIGSDIGVENYHPPENVYGIIANPPCTMFSIARGTTAKIPRNLEEGMKTVKECLRIIWECQYRTPLNKFTSNLKFWIIENPATGMLKYFIGKPAYTYCPSEFGGDFTKKTALWGHFAPPMKPFMTFGKLPPYKSVCDIMGKHTVKDDYERMNKRSICYYDFALAFYEANQ